MIPVTKNAELRGFHNTRYGNALTRVYSPGALLVTAAASPTPSSPQALYSSGLNQTGDPRANASGFWNVTAGSGAAAVASQLGLGTPQPVNVGGSNYYSSGSVGTLGNWMPIALLGLVVWLLFFRK